MPIRIGKGRASILIEGPLADGIEAEIEELLGPISKELKREAQAIYDKAVDNWPVRTGLSRDGWTMATQLMPGELSVEVALVNPIKYVIYIQSGKYGEDPGHRLVKPIDIWIRKPVREANKRLKATLPGIVGKHLNAALGGNRG